MPQRQHLTLASRGNGEFESQVVTVIGLRVPRDIGDIGSRLGNDVDSLVDALLVARGRLDLDKLANQVDYGRLVGPHVVENSCDRHNALRIPIVALHTSLA